MKVRLSILAPLCAAFLAGGAPPALADDPAASGTNAVHYYVSLGDSLARGDANDYPDQLFAQLKQEDPTLQLIRFGCGGESARSMVEGSLLPSVGSSCGTPSFYKKTYPVGGTQLSEAVSFLHAHRTFVSEVTIDIGGNDVLLCVLHLDQSCFDAALPSVATNLATILAALRDAAGPDVPIVGMNYYDPNLAPIWFATHSLAALQVEVNNVVAFNDFLEGFYEADPSDGAAPYADVESAFQVTDTTLADGTPLDVIRECQWTWICFPPPLGPDVHANTAGYGVIAQAFLDVLP